MKNEIENRETTFSEVNHVDVKNEFITAEYPDGIKATDMKMLRFVISQCKRGDKQFYEYEFTASDIAKHMNVIKLIHGARLCAFPFLVTLCYTHLCMEFFSETCYTDSYL